MRGAGTRASRERRGSRAALRFVAWALSALFFAAQLGSAAHFLVVRHGVCPEHGELVHLEAGRGPAHVSEVEAALVASRGVSSGDEVPGLDRGGERGKIEADEHCPTASIPRRDEAALLARAPAQASPPPLAAVFGRDDPHARAGRNIALLRLAPKSSPPAAV